MIAVYGATGYTGRLVAAEMRRRGLTATLCGRSQGRLDAVARSLGVDWPVRAAAVDDAPALRQALLGADVVINCAGPFTYYGAPVIEAALDVGAHYCDTTGEQPYMQGVFRWLDEPARSEGLAVVPGVGFDYVPGDLACAVAASGLEPLIDRVRLGLMGVELRGKDDWEEFEHITCKDWIEQNVSTKVFEKVWGPLLIGKYGSAYDQVAMAWLWSKIHLRFASRKGGLMQKEELGYVMGSFAVYIDEMERRMRDGGVEIAVRDGDVVHAKRAIVSVPAPLRRRILFEPALPDVARRVPKEVGFGRLIKCAAVYERPFWRDAGLSGEALSDIGPTTLTFDNSPPDGKPGVLLGFVGGADAEPYARLDVAGRRDSVLACFARLFGDDAREPLDYVEQDWGAEEWSGGGPTFVLAPGAWSAAGPGLREPVGPIHWAGTETASRWAGFMDGAVRSGERAAAEILAAI